MSNEPEIQPTSGQVEPASSQAGHPEGEVFGTRHGLFGVADDGDTTGFGGLVRHVAMPGASERPYGRWFDEVVDILTDLIAGDGDDPARVIEKVVVDHDELTIFIQRDSILSVCRHLRDDQDLRFELCLGVDGVHYPNDPGRELHATYTLMSVTHNRWLRLEVTCPDSDPTIPSVVAV